MLEGPISFLRGATMMAEIGIVVFFLKYWYETKDRLFILFACAFIVMAVSQGVFCLFGAASEFAPYGYYLRLAAFVLIIFGIVEKNMTRTDSTKSE
ncbi:MAG: DUF5985 family protein [Terriglobales bacterium]